MAVRFGHGNLGVPSDEEATSLIRQAQTYFAGAVSGTALIGAAVVAFVLLVSMQALKDWPLAGIGLGGDESSQGGPSRHGGTVGTRAGSTAPTAGPARGAAGGNAASQKEGGSGPRAGVGTAPEPSSSSPAATPQPSAPGGGTANGSPTTSSSRASSGGGAGSSPAGGSGSDSSGSGSQSTSGAITGAVNETVKGVDEATGGVVGDTGVTKATEEAVNGVAGPESVVGKTVDETVKAVGGLLGGSG